MIQNQIAYLPYYSINNLKIDEFAIYPFAEIDTMITNKSIRNAVSVRLQLNTDQRGEMLTTISILQRANNDFSPFTDEESSCIQDIKYLLFFCSLKTNNMNKKGGKFYSWITSDNFEVIYQNFKVEDNGHIGFGSGGIYSINSIDAIDEVTVQKPMYINKPLSFGYDLVLLNKLKALKLNNISIYKRIISAIQQLYDSYKNSHDISWSSRILLLVMAFEILLDLPDNGQRQQLKDSFDSLLGLKYEIQKPDPIITYQSPRSRGRSEEENRAIRVYFAEMMYLLRNSIIHGNQPEMAAFMFEKQRMFDLGTNFFVLAVERLLDEHIEGEQFYNDIIWDSSDRQFYWVDGAIYKLSKQIDESLVKKYED